MEAALCWVVSSEGAWEVLHEEERQEYARIKAYRRREEWVAARVGLKVALGAAEPAEDPRRWRVRKDRFGRPSFEQDGPGGARRWACAIAHSGGKALVAWSPLETVRLGVDYQVITEKIYKHRQAFVSVQDDVASWDDPLRETTLLWAWKEAASKAMGLGWALDFRRLVVQRTADGRGRVLYRGCEVFQGCWGVQGKAAWAAGYLTKGRLRWGGPLPTLKDSWPGSGGDDGDHKGR